MLRYTFLLLFMLCMGSGNLLANEHATPANGSSTLPKSDSEIILTNDDIKKLYSDFCYKEFKSISGIYPEEADELKVFADDMIHKHFLNDLHKNNTLRKFELYKSLYSKRDLINYPKPNHLPKEYRETWIKLAKLKIQFSLRTASHITPPSKEFETEMLSLIKKVKESYLKYQLNFYKKTQNLSEIQDFKDNLENDEKLVYATIMSGYSEAILSKAMNQALINQVIAGDFSGIDKARINLGLPGVMSCLIVLPRDAKQAYELFGYTEDEIKLYQDEVWKCLKELRKISAKNSAKKNERPMQ